MVGPTYSGFHVKEQWMQSETKVLDFAQDSNVILKQLSVVGAGLLVQPSIIHLLYGQPRHSAQLASISPSLETEERLTT
jgi:hypothetical protein